MNLIYKLTKKLNLQLINSIKELKRKRKDKNCYQATVSYELNKAKTYYRAFHIAKCELKGLDRKQIEPKTKTEPSEYFIEKYKEKIQKMVDTYIENKVS